MNFSELVVTGCVSRFTACDSAVKTTIYGRFGSVMCSVVILIGFD
jgi:hypothetical protein